MFCAFLMASGALYCCVRLIVLVNSCPSLCCIHPPDCLAANRHACVSREGIEDSIRQ